MKFLRLSLLMAVAILFVNCSDDDDAGPVGPVNPDTKMYTLGEFGDSGVSGMAIFEDQQDGSTKITLDLDGTAAGGSHPAHIHMNSAAQGGDILITLTSVDGASGMSTTIVSETNGGNAISYDDLLFVNGYINVHLSADDLGTIVAQGDVGQNELTGESKTYTLEERAVDGISGDITFEERANGFALATISITNTPADGMHPAHIHANSAAMGGDILFTFKPVDGASGMSMSDSREGQMEGELSYTYDDVLAVDGYVNVHLSADDLGTIVSQGDIGENELTGESKTYTLNEKDAPGISGEVTFEQRINGFALATLSVMNTPVDGMHPAHIHMNSAAMSGGILYTFNVVDGNTGMSVSDTREGQGMDEASYTYEDILAVDGYVNVHLSADELGTIVAQGDIGSNELTGESKTYTLGEKDVPSISGEVTFEERINGFALATISIINTPPDGMHPAHIHANTALETGGILYTFNIVNGATGMSVSDTREGQGMNEESYTYADILTVDGYVNVHLSADNLGVIVAQGDIGENELTGESITYPLAEVDVAGISGDVTFEERVNGEALATINLMGTNNGDMHPAHIHENSAAVGGPILLSFTPVDGTTGMSQTNISELDDASSFGYSDVLTVDGYVNVHLSAQELGTLVGQGDIGSNF